MATETTNYHLIKPGDTDPVDNTPLNQNFDNIDEIIAGHVADTNNPHQITKEQVGLGNVDNVATKDVIAELVDSGAKNLLNHTAYTRTVNGVTYTVNADRSITITSDGTNTQSLLYLTMNAPLAAGTYILAGCTGGSPTKYDMRVKVSDTITTNYDGGTAFSSDGTPIEASIVVRASQTLNVTINPMICTAEDYAISPEFVPYAPTNRELYEAKADTSELHALLPNITSSTTIRDYVDSLSKGVYTAFIANVSNPSDSPINANCFVNIYVYSATTAAVELIPIASNELSRTYTMRKTSGTWREWYIVEGTPVTSSTQSTATLMSAKSTSELDVMPEEGAMQS